MPLSQSTISELRGELLSLKDRRRDIDGRIAAIEKLLAGEPGGEQPTLILQGDPVQAVFSGLRAEALNVLAKAPGPMKAPEIAKALERQGFKNTGTTSLTTRIYNDLYRLSRTADLVAREKNGAFVLVTK